MSGQNANGEGSVYQRKDGRWVAAAYLRATTGGRRRVSVYGKSRQDAKAKLRDLLDKAERNVPAAPARLTVAQYLAEWLTHIRQHVRPNTHVAFEINVRRHIVPRIGKRSLAKLTARDVRIMVDAIRADGVGARVVQHVHATLRAALEHAYREEIIPRNVAKLVRTERPIPQKPREPLTADEATHLLKKVQDTPHGALWTVMVMLGLRRSEVCGLRWESIDFEQRTLRITQTVHRVERLAAPRHEDPSVEPDRATPGSLPPGTGRASPAPPGAERRRTWPSQEADRLRLRHRVGDAARTAQPDTHVDKALRPDLNPVACRCMPFVTPA